MEFNTLTNLVCALPHSNYAYHVVGCFNEAIVDIGIDLQEFAHGANRKAVTLHLLRPQLPVQCMIQHIFAIVVTVSCLATQLVGVTKTLFTFLHDEVEQ